MFGRLLKQNKQIWWISNGDRPDLGGIEEDENYFANEHQNPVIRNPSKHSQFELLINENKLGETKYFLRLTLFQIKTLSSLCALSI